MKVFFTPKRFFSIAFLFLTSFLFLYFASKNSPLYPFNDWVDVNAFITVGKGMLNGKVPYKDLFEQKGPILYIVFAIATFIKSDSYLGVFIIEVISFTAYLYYMLKILLFFNIEKTYSLLTTILVTWITVSMSNFVHGGSAEQLFLFALTAALYYFLKFTNVEHQSRKYKYPFLIGIFIAVLFLVKYTLIAFIFPIIVILFFNYIYHKSWLPLLKTIGFFLIGFLLVLLPVLLYFLLNNALHDFFYAYFYINMTAYSNPAPLVMKIKTITAIFFNELRLNLTITILLAFGLISIIKNPVIKYASSKFAIICSYFFLTIVIFTGGIEFMYYYLICAPYMIFGFVYLNELLSTVKLTQISKLLIAALVLVIGVSTVARFHPNVRSTVIINGHKTNYKDTNKEEFFQYKVAHYINASDEKTLLNYDSLDIGAYFASQVTPTVQHFEKQNIDPSLYSGNQAGQLDAIEQKKTKFIVTRSLNIKDLDSNRSLAKNYKIVFSQEQTFENINFVYTLWERQ